MMTLEEQIRTYTEAVADEVVPVTAHEPVAAAPPSKPSLVERRGGWLIAAVAATAVILAIGTVAALVRGVQDTPAGSVSECTSETTTTDLSGQPTPCPPPSDEADIARAAALSLLGDDGFAGLWYSDDGQTLNLGYVGEEPPLELLPGVDNLVERTITLAELERMLDENNAAEGDSGFIWRLRIESGTIERVPIGEERPFFGSEDVCEPFVEQLDTIGREAWTQLTDAERENIIQECGLIPPGTP